MSSGSIFDPGSYDITGIESIAKSDPTPNAITYSSESIRQLNAFLRGEISAVETYRMAIEKLAQVEFGSENVAVLRAIMDEHGWAIRVLRGRILELGGTASDSSGIWGAWAKFTMGAAKLFGATTALKDIKEGEEYGLKEYLDGLKNLDGVSVDLIGEQLVPNQRRHINVLRQIIEIVASE